MMRGILVSIFLLLSVLGCAQADEGVNTKVLTDIVRQLKKLKAATPQRTLIYGTTYPISAGQLEYSALVREFIDATGATAITPGGAESISPTAPNGLRRGVKKVTDGNLAAVIFSAGGVDSENIALVDLGQNLAWPQPKDSEAFRKWLQSRNLPLDFLDKDAKNWDELQFSIASETASTKPALYYYSQLFARDFAFSLWVEKSVALQLAFPDAGVTGSFERTPFGEVTSSIDAFQKSALTSPRINWKDNDFYGMDLLRAGIRGREKSLDSKIYADIPFTPDEKPTTWRKRFYGALAHGAKSFDLGDFQPRNIQAPRELRRVVGELSAFENIVQDGKLRPSQTALFIGETGDIWNNSVSARRLLYQSARASQLPIDIVTESDALKDDGLKQFKVLLLADRNVHRKTADAIARWVEDGGTVIATAGAGMRDELDQRNIFMFERWGIRELDYLESSDTATGAAALDSIKWKENTFPVFDARSRFDAGMNEIFATFQDGSPAVVSHPVGAGMVVYAGFWPQLQNEKGKEKDAVSMSPLMNFALTRISRPILCFEGVKEISFVESNVIESPNGIVIPLINGREKPVKNLAVRLPFLASFHSCTLASGGKVFTNRDALGLFAILDLNATDAIIFR